MMENHSFDNIAGYWDFHPDIDNLRNIEYCNNYTNPSYTIYGQPIQICAGPYEQEVPLNDPDHNFAGTSFEIYQNWNPTNNDIPNMGGFVQRESDLKNGTPGDSAFVIKSYSPSESHTLATLAQNFAFFDAYVSSLALKCL
jgi:phospholipase C